MQQENANHPRPSYWLYCIPVALFFMLAAFLYLGLGSNPRLIPSPLIGKTIPDFSLPKLREPDQFLQAGDLKGDINLFNIWATWCVSCRREHPVLMAIAASKEVNIYGLFYKDEPELGENWLDKHGDPYQANVIDIDGRIGIDFGVYGTPETFIIDKQGIVRHKHTGPLSWDDWQQVLLPIIKGLQQES